MDGQSLSEEISTARQEELSFLRRAAARVLSSSMTSCASGCHWYHGVWPCLRTLGVVSSPWAQYEFYRAAVTQSFANCKSPEVLISGCADSAMLAVVSHIFRQMGVDPRYTIIDRCQTPLDLNAAYAEEQRFAVDCHPSDLLAYQAKKQYDLVVTHSFLGNFSLEQRPFLFQQWSSLLRSGGRVITVNRIRPGEQIRQSFTPPLAEEFCQKIILAATRMKEEFPLDLDRVKQCAREYTAHYHSFPVGTLEELTGYFTESGFQIERLETEGNVVFNTGPSASGKSLRACLVAKRGQ